MLESKAGTGYTDITGGSRNVDSYVSKQKCKLILSLPFKDENIRFSLQFFSLFCMRSDDASSFAWDLPRNLTINCSLFGTKFIQKNLYFAKNSLYKKPLFLRETARWPACTKPHSYLLMQLQTIQTEQKKTGRKVGSF